MSASAVKDAVEQEKKFILPNYTKKNVDVNKELVRFLVSQLDIDGDGSLTRNEFLMRWGSVTKQLFKAEVHSGSGAGQQPEGCVVM